MRTPCCMWDLLPWPEIEPGPPALAAQSLNHWTTRQVLAAAVAAAKSLQSCTSLCDPTDSSPAGSSVPWILQARILQWVAISFSNVSDSVWPHRQQPTRLLCSQDSLGKNTGVGCHFLLRGRSLAYTLFLWKYSWFAMFQVQTTGIQLYTYVYLYVFRFFSLIGYTGYFQLMKDGCCIHSNT